MPNRTSRTGKARGPWSHALLPGLHIKRWILLLAIGVMIAGLGLAFLLRELYITYRFSPLVYLMNMTVLPHWLRGVLLLSLGLLITAIAVLYLNRTIIAALLPGPTPPGNLEMVNAVLKRQTRRQGPRIVVLGGGTGMPQLLRGLRDYTDNITAIVTVADDGGSSGQLRRQMGVPPPGDFRNNIAALSEAEDLMTRLFQYRFAETELDAIPSTDNTLAGHSFGNLFIATMGAVTGSFEMGIAESSRVLAVRGRVLPSTLESVTLCAEICRIREDGSEEWRLIEGESKIPTHEGRIMRVYLNPENARAYPSTIQAILQADLIVAGPGSFFTSVLPNLLVPAIRDAISAAAVPRIFICNVATQRGETDGYSVTDHMKQLRSHVGDAFGATLANSNYDSSDAPSFNADWVRLPPEDEQTDYLLYTGDLIERERPWRHDPTKLASRLLEVYAEMRARQAGKHHNPSKPHP